MKRQPRDRLEPWPVPAQTRRVVQTAVSGRHTGALHTRLRDHHGARHFTDATLRTVLLLADCLRAALAGKGAQFVLELMPEPVRQWWAAKEL